MLDQTMTASEQVAKSQPPFRHEIIVGNEIDKLREKGLSSLEHAMMKHPDGIGFILGTDSQTIQDCVRHHPFVNVKSVYGSWQSKKIIELANDSRIYIGTIDNNQRFFAGEYRYIFADQIENFTKSMWEHVVSRLCFRNHLGFRSHDDCCIYATCYAEDLDELPMWIHKLIEAQKDAYSRKLLCDRG